MGVQFYRHARASAGPHTVSYTTGSSGEGEVERRGVRPFSSRRRPSSNGDGPAGVSPMPLYLMNDPRAALNSASSVWLRKGRRVRLALQPACGGNESAAVQLIIRKREELLLRGVARGSWASKRRANHQTATPVWKHDAR